MASSVVAILEEESLGESIDVDDAIPTLACRRLPGLACRILYVRIRWQPTNPAIPKSMLGINGH
jgi:hypothetical protein